MFKKSRDRKSAGEKPYAPSGSLFAPVEIKAAEERVQPPVEEAEILSDLQATSKQEAAYPVSGAVPDFFAAGPQPVAEPVEEETAEAASEAEVAEPAAEPAAVAAEPVEAEAEAEAVEAEPVEAAADAGAVEPVATEDVSADVHPVDADVQLPEEVLEEARQEEYKLRKNYSEEAINTFLALTRKRGRQASRILPPQLAHLDRHTFSWKRDWKLLLGAFFLPMLILGLVYAGQGFYPFGDKSPLTVDLYHQYAPILSNLRDKLKEGESLWYSWQGGLGMNFLATFAYYAASPFNLIYAVLPQTALPEFVTFLELIKFGLSGLTFALFLRIGVAKTQAEKARDALVEQDSEELADLLPPGGYLQQQYGVNHTSWDELSEPDRKLRKQQKRAQQKAEIERENRVFDSQQVGILVCALLYALSGYAISYSWNIMWLDVLVLFPLVVLGLHRMVNRGHFLLYTISLAACILVNYYIAFFVCVFSFFYFFAYLFSTPRGFDADGRRSAKLGTLRVFQFAFFSLIAGGLSAVLSLATYASLQMTSAAKDAFPQVFSFDFSLFSFLSQHLFGMAPNIRSGLPNVYCGLLAIFSLPLYLSCRKIRLGEKIAMLTMMAFLFLSFNANVLNFLWHGMHYPNQLPYRYAFVYVLLMLIPVFRVIQNFKDLQPRSVALAGGLSALYLILAEVVLKTTLTHELVYLNLFFVGIYTMIFLGGAHRRLPLRVVCSLLVVLILGEISLNTLLQVNNIAKNEYYTSSSGFTADMKPIGRMVKEVEKDDPGFYRFALNERKTHNDPALYNFRGLSVFSSAIPEKSARLMRKLGFHSNNINSYLEKDGSAVTDMLLNVKYVMRKVPAVDPTLEKMELTSAADMDTAWIMYRRRFVLPVGYWAPKTIENWDPESDNALQNQNTWVERMTNITKPLYAYQDIQAQDEQNFTVSNGSNVEDGFLLRADDKEAKSSVKLTVRPNVSGQLYLYVKQDTDVNFTFQYEEGRGIEGLEVRPEMNKPSSPKRSDSSDRIGGLPDWVQPGMMSVAAGQNQNWTRTSNYPEMIDCGFVEKGHTLTIDLQTNDKESGSVELWAGVLNLDVLQQSYDKLSEGGLQVSAFNSNTIQGSFKSPDNGLLLFSIPYDENWTVKVDGQVVKPVRGLSAFLAVPVSAGNHEVSMVYKPRQFKLGLIVSGVSLLLLFASGLIAASVRKRREEEE